MLRPWVAACAKSALAVANELDSHPPRSGRSSTERGGPRAIATKASTAAAHLEAVSRHGSWDLRSSARIRPAFRLGSRVQGDHSCKRPRRTCDRHHAAAVERALPAARDLPRTAGTAGRRAGHLLRSRSVTARILRDAGAARPRPQGPVAAREEAPETKSAPPGAGGPLLRGGLPEEPDRLLSGVNAVTLRSFLSGTEDQGRSAGLAAKVLAACEIDTTFGTTISGLGLRRTRFTSRATGSTRRCWLTSVRSMPPHAVHANVGAAAARADPRRARDSTRRSTRSSGASRRPAADDLAAVHSLAGQRVLGAPAKGSERGGEGIRPGPEGPAGPGIVGGPAVVRADARTLRVGLVDIRGKGPGAAMLAHLAEGIL